MARVRVALSLHRVAQINYTYECKQMFKYFFAELCPLIKTMQV